MNRRKFTNLITYSGVGLILSKNTVKSQEQEETQPGKFWLSKLPSSTKELVKYAYKSANVQSRPFDIFMLTGLVVSSKENSSFSFGTYSNNVFDNVVVVTHPKIFHAFLLLAVNYPKETFAGIDWHTRTNCPEDVLLVESNGGKNVMCYGLGSGGFWG